MLRSEPANAGASWRDCSEYSDEQWDRDLKERGFTTYPYGFELFDSQGRIVPPDRDQKPAVPKAE